MGKGADEGRPACEAAVERRRREGTKAERRRAAAHYLHRRMPEASQNSSRTYCTAGRGRAGRGSSGEAQCEACKPVDLKRLDSGLCGELCARDSRTST